MCIYCFCGDHAFRYDPPWQVEPNFPFIPRPINPDPWPNEWPVDRLRDYLELLERIKKLEDAMGCPCEPNKADYIGMFKEQIEKLEKISIDKSTSRG